MHAVSEYFTVECAGCLNRKSLIYSMFFRHRDIFSEVPVGILYKISKEQRRHILKYATILGRYVFGMVFAFTSLQLKACIVISHTIVI